MCINFYIQHRIFKRRRIDCHTADGVTTTALASRRRAVVGAVDRPLVRPDRGRTRGCMLRRRMRRRGRPATGDASDDQRRTTEETFTKTERHQQTPPPAAAPPAWRSVRYTFTLESRVECPVRPTTLSA